MSAQEDEFLKSLRATFKVEAGEHLQTMAARLLELEKNPLPDARRRLVETVFRAAHSLKGAARAVNFTEIESICQSLEDLFASWKREESSPTPAALDTIHRGLDKVSRIIASSAAAQDADGGVPAPPPMPPSAPRLLVGERGMVENTPPVETVRITVAKLDARLLEAEEMLAVKLAAGQRVAELAELSHQVGAWTKQWAAFQPELRAFRQASERSGPGSVPVQSLARLVGFLDWNRDSLRSLDGKVTAFRQTAEQDRLTVGKLVDDLLEDSKKLLMLPMATLGPFFQKVVRDLCRDQGKEADLILRGEEAEMDKRILEEMKDPLIHILRNCVGHGIETPDQRRRLGKPPRATITLAVCPINGTKVEILVSDDGAGIDFEKVKESAVQHRVIPPEAASRLTEGEALELMFRGGVSTSPILTQLSGRGLGLAIVREKTEKLGGRVSVESRLGEGTAIRVALPVALATFRGLLVEAANRLFVVPTAQVERVARFQPDDVKTVENRETLALNGQAVSLARLAEVLQLPLTAGENRAPSGAPVFVLGECGQQIAFAVDAVLDEQEVLVKRFAKPLARVRNIAGATVLGSGRIALILNVGDLLKSAKKAVPIPRVAAVMKAVESAAKSILVVEDSITSRMLLKGILESAGYRVKTAVDGLEGFTVLRAEHFDMVVSDVEMPRLNGFDLTARIRADDKLAELPVVLVTALETREDRERGIDVGANAYLVKSSLDQSNLLEAVRRLV